MRLMTYKANVTDGDQQRSTGYIVQGFASMMKFKNRSKDRDIPITTSASFQTNARPMMDPAMIVEILCTMLRAIDI